MLKRIPIGISDFRELREAGCEYVDKTELITELIQERGIKVLLLPRPRRFGKTINLSMLRWFFEKRDENLWHLFEGLHVARAGEEYRAHFQKYPVIFISFRGTKAKTFEDCQQQVCALIQNLYSEHRDSIEGRLDERQLADFYAVWKGTGELAHYRRALANLTEYLHQAHGKRPIVLIDEYDAPIHAGYSNGYYEQIIDFFRSFLELGLKDNSHLERAVLTGILRVSKESIFSGLNNVAVYTLLDGDFSTHFGFTEHEVRVLLEKAGLSAVEDAVRSYYDGYEFGGRSIYNPWSILHFLKSDTKQLQPFWLHTSSNELVKELLKFHAFPIRHEMGTLLAGGSIEKDLDTNIVFPELNKSTRALWGLLVLTGYLKAARGPVVPGTPVPPYRLSIPNGEVAHVYRTTFQSWMDEGLQEQGGTLQTLLDALLAGNVPAFEEQLQAFAMYCTSFHDLSARDPERFYQGLMIGLLAALEPAYEVRSNRESGEGRPDVLIKPRQPGKPGVVLELKAARYKTTMKQALAEGHAQMFQYDYPAELRAAGVQHIHAMVIAFDGKKVKVEAAKPPMKTPAKRAARKTTHVVSKKRPAKSPSKRAS